MLESRNHRGLGSPPVVRPRNRQRSSAPKHCPATPSANPPRILLTTRSQDNILMFSNRRSPSVRPRRPSGGVEPSAPTGPGPSSKTRATDEQVRRRPIQTCKSDSLLTKTRAAGKPIPHDHRERDTCQIRSPLSKCPRPNTRDLKPLCPQQGTIHPKKPRNPR